MQLRDDGSNISEPGIVLCLVEIKPTESTEEAIVRETQEGLCIPLQDYQPLYNFKYLAQMTQHTIYFDIFDSGISGQCEKGQLLEGQAVNIFI